MANPVQYTQVGSLQVASALHDFINNEVLPGTGLTPETFWPGFEKIIQDLGPQNEALLAQRGRHEMAIDAWHRRRQGQPVDSQYYKTFLQEIGYILPEGEDFKIRTENVDDEIALIPGPQLVVPVTNARFAVNAANARWGSLYDALYGTDAIDGTRPSGTEYDSARGEKVIAFARARLDEIAPLAAGSHADAKTYAVENGTLTVTLKDGTVTGLAQPDQFKGYREKSGNLSGLLVEKNGLRAEIKIDRSHPIGKLDTAGIADVVVEAAVTTIMDFEDSVATVSPEDKVDAYRNWLGLMKGDLVGDFEREGQTVTRRLQPDRDYIAPDGSPLTLHGRSLMLVRNVGNHMMSDAITDQNGALVPEGIMDAVVTSLIALHDLKQTGPLRNSRTGSVYIVKPKMHGPEDVAFTSDLFNRAETLLGLPPDTLKLGIMDEERRMSLNLKRAIGAAPHRVVFINTGFLDRTGDEIHTDMQAGPLMPKGDMNNAPWKKSYEDLNVLIGIECGLPGLAQIGKGMWARPDDMHAMLAEKGAHPKSGASTAWVPSPTAAVLHALHYYQTDVAAVHKELAARKTRQVTIDDLLQIPLADRSALTPELVQRELDNSAQSILGYVVRWIDQGIGCSKVPDIRNVNLMEDRATLRISSQGIANWLMHGICTPEQVMETLERMAVIVDRQNANDKAYRPMAPNFAASIAFQAACDLIFEGASQPNGYTEFILNRRRAEAQLQAA